MYGESLRKRADVSDDLLLLQLLKSPRTVQYTIPYRTANCVSSLSNMYFG